MNDIVVLSIFPSIITIRGGFLSIRPKELVPEDPDIISIRSMDKPFPVEQGAPIPRVINYFYLHFPGRHLLIVVQLETFLFSSIPNSYHGHTLSITILTSVAPEMCRLGGYGVA